jgi:hypothetical protein
MVPFKSVAVEKNIQRTLLLLLLLLLSFSSFTGFNIVNSIFWEKNSVYVEMPIEVKGCFLRIEWKGFFGFNFSCLVATHWRQRHLH